VASDQFQALKAGMAVLTRRRWHAEFLSYGQIPLQNVPFRSPHDFFDPPGRCCRFSKLGFTASDRRVSPPRGRRSSASLEDRLFVKKDSPKTSSCSRQDHFLAGTIYERRIAGDDRRQPILLLMVAVFQHKSTSPTHADSRGEKERILET